MPPEPINGRDVELIAVGVLCLLGAGVWGVSPDGSVDWGPLVVFTALGMSSFGAAWWDIRTRGGLSIPRDDGEPRDRSGR